MLPGRDGFDVCRDLRREGIETPILMLTARAAGHRPRRRAQARRRRLPDQAVRDDRAARAHRGAAAPRARRRLARPRPRSYAFGDVRVDFRNAEVQRNGDAVRAVGAGVQAAALLHRAPRRGCSRDELLDEVWGYDATPSTRTVDVHVARCARSSSPTRRSRSSSSPCTASAIDSTVRPAPPTSRGACGRRRRPTRRRGGRRSARAIASPPENAAR